MHRARLILLVLAMVMQADCRPDPQVARDRFFAAGEAFAKQGKDADAASQFQSALRFDPAHAKSLLGLARSLRNLGRHDSAAVVYQQLLEVDPNNPEAKLEFGGYLLAAGLKNPDLFHRAQKLAEGILEKNPDQIQARLLRGNALAGLNQLDEAISDMRKVLARDPGNLSAAMNLATLQYRQKDLAAAEATFKDALAGHPDSEQLHLAAAAFYAALARNTEAEQHFRRAMEISPTASTPMYGLASFYLRTGRPGDAERVFKEAAARNPADREALWGLTTLYLQQGRQAEGLKALQDLLARHPEDRTVLLQSADVYLGLNRGDEAEALIKRLLQANPSDPEALVAHARLLMSRGQAKEALEKANQALKLDANLVTGQMVKALLLANNGEIDAAQRVLNDALNRDRTNQTARAAQARLFVLQQRPDDALQAAQQVLEQVPASEDALFARAEALRLKGRLAESKTPFAELCRRYPKNPLYRHRLGMVEGAQGNTARALAELRQAVELAPGFMPALEALLSLHLKANRTADALAEIDRLGGAGVTKDRLHGLRGQVYVAAGNFDSAAAEFRKAIEANPLNLEAYVLLASVEGKRNRVQQAIRELDKAIEAKPGYVQAYLMRGVYFQFLQDTPNAITNYREALRLQSDSPVAANNLAWLLAERGELGEALSLAQTAKKKLPDDPEVADTLGWIHYKFNRWTLATDQLLFSVNNSAKPKPAYYYHLGLAYKGKGDLLLAQQTLRTALELDPKNPLAAAARQALQAVAAAQLR